jgi:alcohol oxidase
VNKAGRWPKWINPETSKRSDAAHGYVHPLRDEQDNLHLLTDSKVNRIIFRGTTAVGVETTAQITFSARKLVVISAGALSSPQILQRSGIGDAAKLRSLNINVVSDLPGVGENYQDHQGFLGASYLVDATPDDTITTVLHSDAETLAAQSDRPLAHNYVDTGIKLRPTEDEVRCMGPAFQKVWNEFFFDKLDKAVIYIGIFST